MLNVICCFKPEIFTALSRYGFKISAEAERDSMILSITYSFALFRRIGWVSIIGSEIGAPGLMHY